jgi:hypothetical protein
MYGVFPRPLHRRRAIIDSPTSAVKRELSARVPADLWLHNTCRYCCWGSPTTSVAYCFSRGLESEGCRRDGAASPMASALSSSLRGEIEFVFAGGSRRLDASGLHERGSPPSSDPQECVSGEPLGFQAAIGRQPTAGPQLAKLPHGASPFQPVVFSISLLESIPLI